MQNNTTWWILDNCLTLCPTWSKNIQAVICVLKWCSYPRVQKGSLFNSRFFFFAMDVAFVGVAFGSREKLSQLWARGRPVILGEDADFCQDVDGQDHHLGDLLHDPESRNAWEGTTWHGCPTFLSSFCREHLQFLSERAIQTQCFVWALDLRIWGIHPIIHPLVNIPKAIENGHRNSWFTP